MKRIYIVLLLILSMCNVKAQSGAGDYQFSVTNKNSIVYNSECLLSHNQYLIQNVDLKFDETSVKVKLKQSPTGWTYNDVSDQGLEILSKNSEQIEVFVGNKATVNDYSGSFTLVITYANESERMIIYLTVAYTQKYGFSNPVTDDRIDFKFY
jgi:hypothetical protein